MKIFVSRRLPGNSLDKLINSGHEVQISEFNRPLTASEFLERASGADAVLSFLSDKLDGEVMDALGPQLRVLSNYAVGYDNIKVDDATERGIVITNTPSDEVNESVAEHTWALLLALTRRIVEADESTRRGAYHGWEPGIFIGQNMVGKTLGVIGLGRIGSMTARRAKGFGMRVLYFNRSRDEKAEQEIGLEFVDFDRLLSESDVVSLHVPLTEETRHMMNKDAFAKMKKGAYLVNTARGAVVHEQDLADALRNGQLAGAAIDVFDNEPYVNPELIAMENVILTPHIASATWEARNKMGDQSVDAILKVLNNEKPDNMVNEEVWEKRRL